MSKSIKLKNDNYLDSKSIVHNKNLLYTILQQLTGRTYYNSDANTFTATGIYYLSTGATNTPENLTWIYLMVIKSTASADIIQFAMRVGGDKIYFRSYAGSSWKDWKKIQGTAI